MSNSNEVKHSALETTAAEAQVEAPTAKIARQVETNAEEAKAAAQQAAVVATTMGEEYTGEPTISATDKLQRDAAKATTAAVLEGKKDVDHVKAVGEGYVEQVKALAQSAIETAQTYLPVSVANKLPNFFESTATHAGSRIVSSNIDIPATSVPLENDPHTTYPSTTTKTDNVDANERAPK